MLHFVKLSNYFMNTFKNLLTHSSAYTHKYIPVVLTVYFLIFSRTPLGNSLAKWQIFQNNGQTLKDKQIKWNGSPELERQLISQLLEFTEIALLSIFW